MAVVQLHYHPAFKDAPEDPLFSLEGHGSSLLPSGMDAAPEEIQHRYKNLRRRVRRLYTEQLWLRVEAILKACIARGVQLVVFPEYAIPAELLERLSKAAGDCVVIAGSHFVGRAVIDQKIYERLGGEQRKDLLRNSVSPVLHAGKLLALVPKLHPAEPELGTIRPGDDWQPVSLPEPIPGPMAVMICLDYLARQTEKHQELVARPYEGCRFVAAPALSKAHAEDDPFRAKALEDARGYRRPVLFANIAQWGRSTIFVSDRRPADNRRFPEQVGLLEAGEEGVIIADVDLGVERAGLSAIYEQDLPLKPVAAASLVYRGIERDYACWLDGLREKMGEAGDEYDRLSGVVDYVSRKRPPLPAGDKESARRRRLLRLRQDIEDESSLERVRQLTDEIELDEKILPLRVVRAALAEGAAREIGHWVRELGRGEFGPVRDRLHEAWAGLERERAGYGVETRKAAEAVAQEAAEENWSDPSQRMLHVVQVFGQEIHQGFEEDQQKAGELFDQGRYAEARDKFQQMRERAEKLIREMRPPADPTLLIGWAAACKLNVAASLLNLQEFEEGRSLLLEIEPGELLPAARVDLADMLASVGEEERALKALPQESEMPDEAARARYAEILQGFQLRKGEVPEQIIDTPQLHRLAATALLQRHDFAGAAEHALWVLEHYRDHALGCAIPVQVLTAALAQTIHEAPPNALLIPRERRARILDELERSFESLAQGILPERTREKLAQSEKAFKALIGELEASPEFSGPFASIPAPITLFEEKKQLAFRLAQEGRLDEALEIMPVEQHPWGDRLNRAALRMMAWSPERPMMFAQALEELRALAKDFPNRAIIEANLWGLLMHAGHLEEALAHARNAFEELPCREYRGRVAGLELRLGHAEQAWELLKDCKLSDRPELLGLYASTAERTGHLSEAERALRRYVELVPGDGRMRIYLAQFLHRYVHKLDEAAAIAWETFQVQADRLDLEALYACGILQHLSGPLNEEQTRRIKAVAAKLKERFPLSAQAEQLRFQLLTSLGDTLDATPPVDYSLLVKEGLAFEHKSADSLKELMQQHVQFAAVVEGLHRRGLFLMVMASTLLRSETALTFTRTLNINHREVGHLCPPVSLVDQPAFATLAGSKILVSELELLLLDELALVPLLREALGPDGGLVVFEHARNRILQNGIKLRIQARPDKLETTEALLRHLEGVPASATKITESSTNKALLWYLEEERLIDATERAFLERYVANEPEPSEAQRRALSEGIVLSHFWVEELEKMGRLSAILDAWRGKICIEPDVTTLCKHQRDELADSIRAFERSDRLHTYLSEGWIQAIPAPAADELPPLREPDPNREGLVLAPLREILAYRRAMLEHSAFWRLNAEFYGSLGLSYLDEVLPSLTWKDNDQIQKLDQMMQASMARDITFPMLVRYLVQDTQRANALLIRLAELGFPDALGAREILYLEQRYKGLGKGEPKRILDRMEWMARTPFHKGQYPARLRLTWVYGEAICNSFLEAGQAPTDRTGLVEALLERMEALGEATQSDALDAMMERIVTNMLSQWQHFWKQDEEQAIPNWDSPVGRLWTAVSHWYGESVERRAAKGRAFRAFWCMPLGNEDDSPNLFDIGLGTLHPLMIHLPEGNTQGEISLLGPEHETLAILSALWPESTRQSYMIELTRSARDPLGQAPFRESTHEGFSTDSVLEFGIGAPPEETGLVFGAREATYCMNLDDRPAPILVRAPPEALLLRALPEARPDLARFLKEIQGPYDGIAYGFLEQIEQDPSNSKLLRDYATHAANALFRLVQDDPDYLRLWGHPHAVTFRGRRDLETLYQILSEPLEPLPEDQSMRQVLTQRCTQGAWHQRPDLQMLVMQAVEVPGYMPASLLLGWDRQNPPPADELEEVLKRIDNPDDTPVGRLVLDMHWLRIAATLFPTVKLTQGEVNLSEILPARFSRLLDSVYDPPKPDTMAAHEPALLRVCADVIQRLAGMRAWPQRDGIWITFRLFQWLCLQLDSISPDARLAGIQKLVRNAPPPAASPLQDRLDPRGFGRDQFDYRLAAVLHALGTMEEVAAVVHRQHETPTSPSLNLQSVSSSKLEDRLLELAQRVAPPSTLNSKLDWNAPDNIPDLALRALLRLNRRRFADLSPESRTRRFERLPDDPQHLDKSLSAFTAHIVLAAAISADALSPDERTLLENKVRAMVEGPATRQWRLWTYVALYAAGSDHLEADALQFILHDIDQAHAAEWVGAFLLRLTKRSPERLEPTLQTLMDEAQQRSVDCVPIVTSALSRIRVQGEIAEKKLAGELLIDLANRPPFRDDPRMSEVLGFFGLRRRNT